MARKYLTDTLKGVFIMSEWGADVWQLVVYDEDKWLNRVYMCRRIFYPFYRSKVRLRNLKYKLYHFLNNIGVMKTPWGEIMKLSDVFKRSR